MSSQIVISKNSYVPLRTSEDKLGDSFGDKIMGDETTILDLSRDPLLCIFHKLGHDDLLSLTRVCRKFRVLANIALETRVNFWLTIGFSKFDKDDHIDGEISKKIAKVFLEYEKKHYLNPIDVGMGTEQIREKVEIEGLEDPHQIISRLRRIKELLVGIKETYDVIFDRKMLIGGAVCYPVLAGIATLSAIPLCGWETAKLVRHSNQIKDKIAFSALGVFCGLGAVSAAPLITLAYPVGLGVKYLKDKKKFYRNRDSNKTAKKYMSEYINQLKLECCKGGKDIPATACIADYVLKKKINNVANEESLNLKQISDEINLIIYQLYGRALKTRNDLLLKNEFLEWFQN